MTNSFPTEETMQKVEWRVRLVVDLIARQHDDATLEAMLNAGLEQAYSEGLQEAASVCQAVADGPVQAATKHVASTLAASIRELDRRNRRDRANDTDA